MCTTCTTACTTACTTCTRCCGPPPLAPSPACRDQHLAQSTFCEGFFFNEAIVQLAEEVRQRIGAPFNGLHLRLEPDAAGFNRGMGEQWMLSEYVRTMKQAAFKPNAMVYAASGLLYDGPSNGAPRGVADAGGLSGAGHAHAAWCGRRCVQAVPAQWCAVGCGSAWQCTVHAVLRRSDAGCGQRVQRVPPPPAA